MMQSDACSLTESPQNWARLRAACKASGCKPDLVQLWNAPEMIDEMRCSLCKELVPAPVQWACAIGHPTCNQCSVTVPLCAWEPRGSRDARNMCRSSFAPTRLKLHDLIYNKSTFQCPFKARGCEDQLEGSALLHHCRTCTYNPFRNNTPNAPA